MKYNNIIVHMVYISLVTFYDLCVARIGERSMGCRGIVSCKRFGYICRDDEKCSTHDRWSEEFIQ